MAVLAMAARDVLLDEPFAALDLPTRSRLTRRLEACRNVVTISHDPARAWRRDRVHLAGGRAA